MNAPTAKDRLLTGLLKILPQHLLAGFMYKLARSKWPALKNLLITRVVKRYSVDLGEAKSSSLDSYPSFNAFFTRALKPGARPIASDDRSISSPADGKVNNAGSIEQGQLIQAKGHGYGLMSLLAGDQALAGKFLGGSYATIYLSPRDYHRVHMPVTGQLLEMHFVPGDLFSVSEATTQLVPELFARNERVICIFDTMAGPMAVILVGAIFVGSMETVWEGEVRGPGNDPTIWRYQDEQAVTIRKGEELGRFNMGSTVIVLLPRGQTHWEETLQPGATVRMGETIGRLTPDSEENSTPDPENALPASA
jgi:phosphatidylserine decarboxylase